jgi:hypothetical protein
MPDGTLTRVPPKQLGLIGSARHIRFASTAGESSHFDSSFENEFNKADNNFPQIISWLERLEREFIPDQELWKRFLSQPASGHLEKSVGVALSNDCAIL